MQIKNLHLPFAGSSAWHRPTATTSPRYSHRNEHISQRGEHSTGQKGQHPVVLASQRCKHPVGWRELGLFGKTTFPALDCYCQSREVAMKAQLCFAPPRRQKRQAVSGNGMQEKAQRHMPCGLLLPGNYSILLCVTQTKKSPQITCTIDSHAQNKAQRQHFGEGGSRFWLISCKRVEHIQ